MISTITLNEQKLRVNYAFPHTAERYATKTLTGSAGECCAPPLYYGGECEKLLTA